MSKEGASVAVGVFFNIAVAVAPNVSDEHKRIAFFCTVPLLLAAIIWWVVAHFRTPKPKPAVPQPSFAARDIANSTVANAARDIHQTFHQQVPSKEPEKGKEGLPDFFYQADGGQVVTRAIMKPGANHSVAQIVFRLCFTNGGDATAYNASVKAYDCWIYEQNPRATVIETATSVGRTPSGQNQSLEITTHRDWDSQTGMHQLNIRKNHVTMLLEITFRLGSGSGVIYKNEPIWLTWNPALGSRMSPSTEADVAIANPLIEELKSASEKPKESIPAQREQSPRTIIEEIDDLLLTYNALLPIFGGLTQDAPYGHLDRVVEDTTDFLRKNLPDYVDKFNVAANDPAPFKSIPPDIDNSTFDEWAASDNQMRRQGWDTILSATAYLERLREKLYIKLP